jgi:hypothetical protein
MSSAPLTTQAAARRRALSLDWGLPLALAVLVVGGALGMAYVGGSIDRPYGDDWSFSRIAFHLYETGGLQFNGWEAMSLVGQLLWAYPFMAIFGPSVAVLQWATAVAGVIGVVAGFAVLRRFLPPGVALFGAAVVAIVPAYGILTTTYMTDISAFAAEMVCLALGLAALDADGNRRRLLFGASLGIGLFGFAAREIAIAAPLAVLVSHLVVARRGGAGLWRMIWPPAVLFAAAGAFLAWRHALPGARDAQLSGGAGLYSVFVLGQAYFTLALALLPAVVAGARTAWRDRFTSAAGTGAAVVLAAFVVAHELRHDEPIELPLGDYYGRSWKQPMNVPLADSAPAFLPESVWAAIDALAVLAGILLAVVLARAAGDGLRRIRMRHEWDAALLVLALFGLFYAAPLVFRVFQGWPVFDRYLLPLTVPLMALALGGLGPMPGRRSLGMPALVTAVALAVLTVVIVVHDTALRGAQWEVGEEAVTEGISPRDVDAGYAWVGYHDEGPVGHGPPSTRWKDPKPFYAELFPDAGNCLSTSLVPLSEPQLRLVTVKEFDWIPGLGQRKIWLYRNRQLRCGPSPP